MGASLRVAEVHEEGCHGWSPTRAQLNSIRKNHPNDRLFVGDGQSRAPGKWVAPLGGLVNQAATATAPVAPLRMPEPPAEPAEESSDSDQVEMPPLRESSGEEIGLVAQAVPEAVSSSRSESSFDP